MSIYGQVVEIVAPIGSTGQAAHLQGWVKPHESNKRKVRVAFTQGDEGKSLPIALVGSCIHQNRPLVWKF